MKPPIRVNVRTDNLHTCSLDLIGADGVADVVTVPNDGNVYQGLHRARAGLEGAINKILASHGIVPEPEPEETVEEEAVVSGEALAADTEPPPLFEVDAHEEVTKS